MGGAGTHTDSPSFRTFIPGVIKLSAVCNARWMLGVFVLALSVLTFNMAGTVKI